MTNLTFAERELFDQSLEALIRELPKIAHQMLEGASVVVEDIGTEDALLYVQSKQPELLCGLHSGLSLEDRKPRAAESKQEEICLFRYGILRAATKRSGELTEDNLKAEIRYTLLHEMGHHFNLDAEDLRRFGYHE